MGVKFFEKGWKWYLLRWWPSENERGRREKYFKHIISGRVSPKFARFEFENKKHSGSGLSYLCDSYSKIGVPWSTVTSDQVCTIESLSEWQSFFCVHFSLSGPEFLLLRLGVLDNID